MMWSLLQVNTRSNHVGHSRHARMGWTTTPCLGPPKPPNKRCHHKVTFQFCQLLFAPSVLFFIYDRDELELSELILLEEFIGYEVPFCGFVQFPALVSLPQVFQDLQTGTPHCDEQAASLHFTNDQSACLFQIQQELFKVCLGFRVYVVQVGIRKLCHRLLHWSFWKSGSILSNRTVTPNFDINWWIRTQYYEIPVHIKHYSPYKYLKHNHTIWIIDRFCTKMLLQNLVQHKFNSLILFYWYYPTLPIPPSLASCHIHMTWNPIPFCPILSYTVTLFFYCLHMAQYFTALWKMTWISTDFIIPCINGYFLNKTRCCLPIPCSINSIKLIEVTILYTPVTSVLQVERAGWPQFWTQVYHLLCCKSFPCFI